MFNVRPDKRWFGFYAKPPEDPTGFHLNADSSVRGTLPGDLSTAFLGYDLGAGAAVPGSTMFNVRPEQDLTGLHNFKPPEEAVLGGTTFNVRPEQGLPGLHNFKPPEETVPGCRMSADGSRRNDTTPAARPGPDVASNPFGVFDLQSQGPNAFMPVGNGSPPPYPAYDDGVYRWLSRAPMLHPGPIQSAGSPPLAPILDPLPSSALSFAETTTGKLPLGTKPSFLDRPASDGSRPSLASVSFTAGTLPASGRRSPLSFAEPISGRGLSTREADITNAAAPGAGPASNGERLASDHAVDPNIVRVSTGDDEVQIAQQQETPRSKLRKDPSPGVPVVLPDGSTIPHPESPTGKLMAPTAALSEVATAGRKVGKQYLQMLERGHPPAIAYLGVAMGSYLGHGGTFDHQRRGNWFTGYTHLKQFEAVSNLNVGLFGQQAGLTLDELLTIAGKFAC